MPRRFKAGRIKQTRSRKQTVTFAKSVMGDGTHIETLPTDRLMAQERENDPVFHSQRKLGGTIDDSIPFPPTVFYWPGQYTLAATTGTDPTFTRATAATFEDFEGVIRTAESSEPRFVGARRVENLITASEDMTNAAYTKDAGVTEDSPTQLSFDGVADNDFQQNVTIVDDGSGVGGRTFVFTLELGLVAGTISANDAIQIILQGNALTATTVNIGSSVDGTPQRYAVTASTDAAGTVIDARLRVDDAITLTSTKWQVEEVTGQTNQNPSEYVSTGVGTGAEELVNGDDWVGATGTTPPDSWTTSGSTSTYEVANGQLTQDRNGEAVGADADMVQSIPTKIGKDYVIAYKIVSSTDNLVFLSYTGGSSAPSIVAGANKTVAFTAISTTTEFRVRAGTSLSQIIVWDYISIKEASHGANIDGVQYFNTLNANTVTAGVVTEATGSALTSATTQFMELDGVVGSYVSTPDSVANSIRQSIVVEADCAADDWDLATFQTLNSKWGSGVSWLLVLVGGRLRLYIGSNSSQPSVASSLLGFSDGTRHKVRAAYDALTQIVTFSEFVDGDWIVISSGAIAAPFIDDTSNSVQAGGWASGINPFNGKIYSSTVTKGPTPYPYVLLDGVSGTYVSTPDSAANSVTGDLTLIAWAALDDWTPAATSSIITKWVSAGDQRSFLFRIVTDGTLQLITDVDGDISNNVTSFSTAATGFANGTGHWVRVSFDVSAGTVNFFTSDQPSDTPISILSWVQLGGANVAHAQTAIFDSTAAVEIGGYDGGSSPLSGKVARAVVIKSTDPTAAASVDFYPQPYLQGDTNFTSVTGELWTLQGNAIATSPIDDGVKVDCDAGDYVSGSTFVSSTSGETWTLNGNASVFQPPVDASGPFGYLAEGAGTNVMTYSNDATNADWSATNLSVTANSARARSGALTAQLVTVDAGNSVHNLYQITTSVGAGTTQTYSAVVEAGTHTEIIAGDRNDAVWHVVTFDLSSGVAVTQTNATGTITPLADNKYLISVTFTRTGAGYMGVGVMPTDSLLNQTYGNAWNAAGTETIYVSDQQVEAGAFPSSYIATAAAAVTRNADTLSSSLNEVYPLTAYAETVQSVDQSSGAGNSYIFSVNENTVINQDEFYIRTNQSPERYEGVVYSGASLQVDITGGTTAAGVLRTLTMAVALNDVEMYVDGASIGSDTSAALPAAPTLMNIGMNSGGGNQPYATVRNVKLFDGRLTDAEVADL